MTDYLTKRIHPTGPPQAEIAFIGEAGGESEYRKGRAFQGKAGQLFDALLWAVGIDRSQVYVDNVYPFWTGPGNPDPPTAGVLKYGAELERKLLTEVKPKIVCTLGRVSTRFFLGDVDMEECHGLGYSTRRTSLGAGFKVLPAYHPAAGLHNPDLLQFTAWDLEQLAKARKAPAAFWTPREDQFPDPEYREWGGDESVFVGPTVYVDTEGVPGRPYCLTFTCLPGMAFLILASCKHALRRFADVVRRLRLRVCFHNSMWDLQMLREMGVELDSYSIGDTMVKAYELRVEPQGLKQLARRHAFMEMDSYDELTLPHDNQQMEDFILGVVADPMSDVRPDPVPDRVLGVQKLRQPQTLRRRCWSILAAAEKDPGARLRKRWLDIEPEVRAGFRAPDFTLALLPFDKALRYACRDADATCRIDRPLSRMLRAWELESVYRLDMEAIPLFERMQSNGMLADKKKFEALGGWLDTEMDRIREAIQRKWNGDEPFNPDSGDQTAHLLYERIGLVTARMTKSRARMSTDDKALEALRGQHPVIEAIGDYRERSKVKQFVDSLPGYIGDDGRIRGSIRVTRVVTGRPSMTKPNLFAIPTRTEIGRRVRGCIVAPAGYLLGTCDLDQIEMRVMADMSRDERLVKLFVDGKDVHANTASLMFGIKPEQVDPMKHRYPAKRVGFGVITGIQAPGLLDQMHLAGVKDYSLSDCEGMIRTWFEIYPEVKEFMKQCRLEARRAGAVRDRAGRLRLLPAVRSPFEWQAEEALRQSHSHKIQGTAAWLMKRAMKRLWDSYQRIEAGGKPGFEPLLQIYDEVIVEFPAKVRAEVERLMLLQMTADSDQFCVPIKAKFASGPDWGALEK